MPADLPPRGLPSAGRGTSRAGPAGGPAGDGRRLGQEGRRRARLPPIPAADRYDAEVAAALAPPIPAALAGLDPALDDELLVAGRAAWQVLAGAADGTALRGQLRCAVAPYDVTYLVASWESAAAS